MPRLSAIGNADTVDSQYADRTVVYVEAPMDSTVFERLMGMDNAARITFKTPTVEGGGYSMVCAQVAKDRLQNLPVFGLLDGEAAAHLGGLEQLLDCATTIFDVPAQPGIFFLNEHELENLLIMYGDACEFLVHNVALAGVGSRTREQIEARLGYLTRRFFIAAILKYAALKLREAGEFYALVNAKRFGHDGSSTKVILQALKAEITQAGLDWAKFRAEVFRITRLLRKKFKDEGLQPEACEQHLLRLADGKNLMITLGKDFEAGKAWEGQLLNRYLRSPQAGRLRDELLVATGA